MQQQQHSATETAGQGGVILFWRQISPFWPKRECLKMKKILITTLMAFTVHTPASALTGFVSGNTFLEKDRSQQLNYVLGVLDANSTLQEAFREGLICVPEKVTAGQVADMAKLHFDQHPEKRHLLAASVILVSMKNAFPCK